MPIILTKKSDTASAVPLAADLTNNAGGAELAVNATDKRLFSKTSGGSVVELGTNPSSLTMPNGTANGVLYLNGSKVVTSGSALTFDGTNFGIGAATALKPLDISFAGTSGARRFLASYDDSVITIKGANASNDPEAIRITGDNIRFNTGTSGSGSEVGRFTSTGLGIGTSSIGERLVVSGSASVDVYKLRSNTSAPASTDAFIYRPADNTIALGTANTERMRIDTSGNLGLGVTPSAWFTGGGYKVMQIGPAMAFDSGTDFRARIAANGFVNSAGDWKYLNTGFASNYSQVSGQHQFYTAASGTAGNAITFSQAMTLDSSGNLLVGTTSTSNGALINWYKASGTIETSLGGITTAQNHIVFANPNGNVGSIQVNGSATSYNTSSDYRLKNTIAPMTGALVKVALLKPCTYKWNVDGSEGEGFIAHELAEVVPQCVTGEKDAVDEDGNPKYQGIDTSFLVATLTAALQELNAKFDAYVASHP